METPRFVVLPEGLLHQLSTHCESIEDARKLAHSLTMSGHEAAVILQPLSVFERVKESAERTLYTLAHDTAGALLDKFLSDGGVSPLSGAQLSLVSDTTGMAEKAAIAEQAAAATRADVDDGDFAREAAAQADGHADEPQKTTAALQCGFVAEDGRVCVAMPHDEGGHLLQPPVTDATRQVLASGQP